MQNENRNEFYNQKEYLFYTAIFFMTPIVVGFSSYFSNMDTTNIMRNVIISIIGIGLTLYMILQANIAKEYLFDNAVHIDRTCILYTICLLGIAFMSQQSNYYMLFPYTAMAAMLLLFSNFHIGLMMYLHCMILFSVLADMPLEFFLLYLILGLVVICILRSSNKCFKIIWTVVLVFGQYIILYAVFVMLMNEKGLYMLQSVSFLGGLASNTIVLLISLLVIDKAIINKYKNKYDALCNPEHELLTKLKTVAPSEYYNAIHTAYLSDRLSKLLYGDSLLAKTGGYYHKIGLLQSKNHVSKSIEIGKEHNFPPALIQLIREYTGCYESPKTLEAVIVMLSDAIVSTIMYLFEKEPDRDPDYDKIIEAVFKKKYESGILKDAGITLSVFHQMKEYYKSEVIYYEFLR